MAPDVDATMSDYVSPALGLPGACPPPEGSPDAGVPWHYGDPHAEQRRLVEGQGAVDLSHRGVVTVTGPDRLTWLHSLTTQHLDTLGAGESTTALILSPHGHVEHELHPSDDGATTWITVEPVITTPAASTARRRTTTPSNSPHRAPTKASSSTTTGTAPTGSRTPPICAPALR